MKPFLSFASVVLAIVLTWTHAHPALVGLACTSAVSLVYDRLAKYPRVHAAFQILAGMGFDVPKIADGFTRVFTGQTVPEAKIAAVETAVEALIPVHVDPPGIAPDLLETMKARVALEKNAK